MRNKQQKTSLFFETQLKSEESFATNSNHWVNVGESEGSKLPLFERETLDLKLKSLESTSSVPMIRHWKSNREQQIWAKQQHSSKLPPKNPPSTPFIHIRKKKGD